MSRPSINPPTKSSRHLSQAVIALATLAMTIMIADMVVHSAGDGPQQLALLQLVLALVSLVVGVIYLFGDRDGTDEAGPSDAVIDLRDTELSAPPPSNPPPVSRQIPDARASNAFA